MGKQRFSKNKIKFLLLLTFITISTSALFIFYREPIKVEACDTQNNLQEFLYDINEQPSFILTSFQDGGYEISSAVTGEPIEFSKINNLPYVKMEKGGCKKIGKMFIGLSDVTIETAYDSKPDGWQDGWNGNCEVVWGVKFDT